MPEPEITADEAPPTAQGGQEEMLVTGSRIRRTTSFTPAAPVQVIDRKQLEFSGAQNLGDVVQYLSAAGGSDFSGRNQGGWGLTQVNLRGLGPQATLVLINGRRVVATGMVPSTGGGTGSIVDIGQIPISAIERIEVLTGGGSAIYGADAVAGVVNVITRKDYTGLRVDATAQTTDKLDHSEYVGSATLGASSDKARANLSVGIMRQTPLAATDRDWTAGTGVSQVGNPATFIITTGSPKSPYKIGVNPDPDCENKLAPRSKLSSDGFCTVDSRDFFDIMPPVERISALGYGEYDITDHTYAFLELGLSSLRAQSRNPPSFPVLQQVIVPENHIDNPFGAPAQYLGAPLTDARGSDVILSEDDTLRGAAGLHGDFEKAAEGTFAEGWEWELFGTYGRSHVHGLVPDSITDRVQTALNSCSDPKDLSACFNPFFSSVTGTGTPNSEAVLDGLRGNMQWFSDSWLATADVGLNGDLFELPGGDLGFAVGGQYRYEERQSDVDHDGNLDRYGFVLGNADATAKRNIYAGYLELVWPFYDGIEVQTAARLESYETVGSRVSPQASLVLIPAEIIGRDKVVDGFRRLRLRGMATSAFRAPSIYEVFPGYVTSILQFDDEGPVPAFRPVQTGGNPDLTHENALVLSGGIEWSPVEQWGLTGTFWSYDYEDRIVAEDVQQLYHSNKNDPEHFVRNPTSGVLEVARVKLQNAAYIREQGIDFTTGVKLDLQDIGLSSSPAGTFQIAVDGAYILKYDIPSDLVAKIKLNDKTPNDSTDNPTVTLDGCKGTRCNVAGLRNADNIAPPLPRLRLNVPLSWSNEHHAVALIVHLIGSYKDDANPDLDTGELPKVDTNVTLDLTYGYTLKDVVGEATTIRVGIVNLLDTDPPFLPEAGFDPFTHDPRGRMVFARLTQEF